MESQTTIKPTGYKWWKDKKMIGTIILFAAIVLQIFAFVKVPFLSSINGYTVGMLFGYYTPLFYFFVIYQALILIFNERAKLPSWVKLTAVTYWIVAISIMFISTSTGYYQSKNGFTSFGSEPWKSFDNWYDNFTDHGNASSWTPENTNGGIIGVFLYSFIAMMLTGVGALIVSIGVLVIAVSLLITGSSIGLYKDISKRKKMNLKDKEIKDAKSSNVEEFIVPEEIKTKEAEKNSDTLPFDDPF